MLLFSSLLAQAPDTLWTRTYGGDGRDIAYSLYPIEGKNYIVTGYTTSFGAVGRDVYLLKLDQDGNEIWTSFDGGDGYEEGYSVIEAPDSGIFVVGYTESFGAGCSDVCIMRFHSHGGLHWLKTYGGYPFDYAHKIIPTVDNAYIIVGNSGSFDQDWWQDVWILKINENGDTLWTKNYGGIFDDYGMDIVQTTDSGYIIVGRTDSFGNGNGDVYLIKVDSAGDTLWTKVLHIGETSIGRSILQTRDNGYIITGSVNNFGPGGANLCLIKTNDEGDILWTKKYGGPDDDCGYSIKETNDGGFIIGGCYFIEGENSQFYLVRTDSTGDTLWTKTVGGNDCDRGFSLQIDGDGGYLLAGETYSFGPGYVGVYLVKLAENAGVSEWLEQKKGIDEIRFNYHPNPFTTVMRIELLTSSKNQRANLDIYDASGRLVKSIKLETSTFELGTDLTPGIYFLKLNGKPVGKVVKVM